jgi:NAD(P) transhydrogenase subunit alpha
LIPASAVEAMRTGSVIVDLAAETGGNCELTAPGEVVVREGVTIIGTLNLPATMPVHASQMYSRVIQNLFGLLLKDGQLDLNLDDEIIRGMCITHNGEIIQEQTRKAMHLDDASPPAPPEPPAPPAEEHLPATGNGSAPTEREATKESPTTSG